jgi:DeoR/GlpR family transcriptional regulator of sugar metabolism
VDAAFVSTSAMDAAFTYHQEQEEIVLKRAMINSARQKFLLIDSTKMPRAALYKLLPVVAFDCVIVDDAADKDLVKQLRERVRVETAAATSRSSATRRDPRTADPGTGADGLGSDG